MLGNIITWHFFLIRFRLLSRTLSFDLYYINTWNDLMIGISLIFKMLCGFL